MTVKAKLASLLEAAASFMDCPDVDEVADFLIKNGVTILPDGAIILTKEEIAAIKEYGKKRRGGDVLEK